MIDEIHIFELRNEEINVKKILAVINATYAVAKRKPEKLSLTFLEVYLGLEIISRLPPVKLSGQTYFCSDTTHFWQDKYPLHHISINSPPPPLPHDVYISNKYIFYAFTVKQPQTQCTKSGTHGTAATFGKIIIIITIVIMQFFIQLTYITQGGFQ